MVCCMAQKGGLTLASNADTAQRARLAAALTDR